MNNSGIYKILNTENGHFYIGSTANLPKRKWDHFSELRNNKHANQHLQRAFTKYGEQAFSFIPVFFCSIDNLLFYEQLFIDQFKPVYNIAKVAGASMRGLKRTPESLAKASAKLRGRKLSEEHKTKISAAHMGKIQGPHSEEHKKKISKTNIGKKHKKESIEKMRAWHTGKIMSDEARTKNGKAHSKKIIRTDPITLETKEYPSALAADREDGFKFHGISKCCNGKLKTYKGFYWKFI